MGVGTADLHEIIVTLWEASALNAAFNSYWSASDQNEFPVLNETEAEAAQPWPYCVFHPEEPQTPVRMSGSGNSKREIRDVPGTFKVWARYHGTSSAKSIAADLAEEILKVFGGHPTVQSAISDAVDLNHGQLLIVQYEKDFPVRMGNEEYCWTIKYNFRLDVPVSM